MGLAIATLVIISFWIGFLFACWIARQDSGRCVECNMEIQKDFK